VNPPDVIRSLVTHPAAANSSTNLLQASAGYGIDFDLIDLDFAAPLYCGRTTTVSYLLGARYAMMDQDFTSRFSAIGATAVDTNIDFDGAGLRVGAELERVSDATGLFVYGRSAASLLAGEFNALYTQADQSGVTVVRNDWTSGRIVPVLDLEVGVGWVNVTGRKRFSAGYSVSGWFNSVLIEDYIAAVRGNEFIDLGDTLTLDGITGRFEWRF
jgi:hypothetical protein